MNFVLLLYQDQELNLNFSFSRNIMPYTVSTGIKYRFRFHIIKKITIVLFDKEIINFNGKDMIHNSINHISVFKKRLKENDFILITG